MQDIILQTKLHRPPVPRDHVPRTELLNKLDASDQHSLVLVSAPAGYGKSTLVSSWLERSERPSAWLSLDENDNDLHQFLSYFVSALQTLFPKAVSETMALVHGPDLPPLTVLASSLLNDLERINQFFVVVLDDIHRIKQNEICDFFNLILQHPSQSMQLVLVGRRDPVLPIASLRAEGKLTELRMRELRFSVDEADRFLQTAIGYSIEKDVTAALVEKGEGWVTGLRLAVLAMIGQDDHGSKLLEIKGTTHFVMDYLVNEVLERQPTDIRDYLLHTSILKRFSAPLCDAVLSVEKPGKNGLGGLAFIDWLQTNNLFIVPLDVEGKWFRYHHLFRDLLIGQMKLTTDSRLIAAMYSQAASWSEGQGLIDDALYYALLAGDEEAAADIVERHKDEEFDSNRWFVVNRWLDQLPDRIKSQRPNLLLTSARVMNDRFRLNDVPLIIERAQSLINEKPTDAIVKGELFHFLGFISFWQGDGANSQAFQEQAFSLVPEDHAGYLRGQLELYAALTCHINGNSNEALQKLRYSMDKRNLHDGHLWERLQFGLATIHLLAGNLAPAYREAQILLDKAIRSNHMFVEAWAAYLLGVVTFQRGEFSEARSHLERVVKHRYVVNMRAAVDSMVGLAIILQLQGELDAVEPVLEQAESYALWTEDRAIHEVALSGRARIALLRGEVAGAVRWQRGFDLPANVPSMLFFIANPWITECRVLLATGTDVNRASASEKLQSLWKETSSLHYSCQAIDVVSLLTQIPDQEGGSDVALDYLKKAVALGTPGEWIRPFVELGTPMAVLLRQLLEQDSTADHAKMILKSFAVLQPAPLHSQPLEESLTIRELDVLEQLSMRLQNKEIADKLYISPKTVKAHLSNIYQKLQVSNRRDALIKAGNLRILPAHEVNRSESKFQP